MKPETPPKQKEHPTAEPTEITTPHQLEDLKSVVQQSESSSAKRRTIGAQSANLTNISETEQELDVSAHTGQTGSEIVPEEQDKPRHPQTLLMQ